MTSDEIRERFLSFFESRDHKRIPSGSLVPAEHDPSVLLTTAGMHPLKPYFQGREKPPHHRLTSCQKCFRTPDDLPGGDNERFLEYWNLVFMQFEQNPVNVLTPLPAQNIDTGLGLNRLAAILQGVTSVFDTDQFVPLIGLGEQLSGKRAGSSPDVDRALRVLADHTRGMSFLIADGVVPSNEDRGYVLRRLMRRAIVPGRRIGIETGFLPRFAA